jgi:molybdenum cofactor synthesis domain-containing protein
LLAASIVVIGDEILGGYVTDTNSPWLAERLRLHGVPLTRVHVVPDTADAIDEALQLELARARPRLIVTSGGIGSTPDDLTYEAVAASLDRELVEDPTIGERIDGALAWSRDQGLEVTDRFAWHLRRMARVPAGSHLLLREQGWAPGVAVDLDGGCLDGGVTIVVLPGVPSEFRSIVAEVVEPRLLAGRNPLPTVVELEHRFPESTLNLVFDRVLAEHPEVRLGSYPGRPMLVRLSGPEGPVGAAATLVREALAALEDSPAGERLAHAWSARRGDADDDRQDPDGDAPDAGDGEAVADTGA